MEVNQEMSLGILDEQFRFQCSNRQLNMKAKQLLNLESCMKWNCHHPVSFCSEHLAKLIRDGGAEHLQGSACSSAGRIEHKLLLYGHSS